MFEKKYHIIFLLSTILSSYPLLNALNYDITLIIFTILIILAYGIINYLFLNTEKKEIEKLENIYLIEKKYEYFLKNEFNLRKRISTYVKSAIVVISSIFVFFVNIEYKKENISLKIITEIRGKETCIDKKELNKILDKFKKTYEITIESIPKILKKDIFLFSCKIILFVLGLLMVITWFDVCTNSLILKYIQKEITEKDVNFSLLFPKTWNVRNSISI